MITPVLALASAAAFGLAGVLLRRALQHVTPLVAAVLSVTVTTAIIWLAAAATAPLSRLLTWRILPFVAAGLAAPGLGRLLFFVGVDRVGVARAASINSTTPLFAVVLAIAVLGERPPGRLLVGAACIVSGGLLLATRARHDAGWRRRDLAFPALGALSFAARDVISRWGLRDYREPLVAAAAAAGTSLVAMWLVAALAVRADRFRLRPAGLGYLALCGTAESLAYLTMWRALALADVSLVSPLVNAHSIVAVALAAVVLRDLERVTWRLGAAAGLIVAGVFVVLRSSAG